MSAQLTSGLCFVAFGSTSSNRRQQSLCSSTEREEANQPLDIPGDENLQDRRATPQPYWDVGLAKSECSPILIPQKLARPDRIQQEAQASIYLLRLSSTVSWSYQGAYLSARPRTDRTNREYRCRQQQTKASYWVNRR